MSLLKSFGTLYLDGKAVQGGVPHVEGQMFTIGNTEELKPLRWISAGSKFIAERNVLSEISWKELDKQGFTKDQVVTINGVEFSCGIPIFGEPLKKRNPPGWY